MLYGEDVNKYMRHALGSLAKTKDGVGCDCMA